MKRTPSQLTEAEWIDIERTMSTGTVTWAELAEKYRMSRYTLGQAARQRGIKGGRAARRSPLVHTTLKDEPDLRLTISELARKTGIGDPEPLMAAIRDKFISAAESIEHDVTGHSAVDDYKYIGMPALQHNTRPGMEHKTLDNRNLVEWVSREEFTMRDSLALLDKAVKIEEARLPYNKPKLVSSKIDMDINTDIAKMSDEELDAAIAAAEEEENGK